jgi:hypothetical protein
MPNTKTLHEQLLNAALSGVQHVERFACHRVWHWVKEGIEVAITTSRLLDPFLPLPFLQPALELVHHHELSLGLSYAAISVSRTIGDHQALTHLCYRFLKIA